MTPAVPEMHYRAAKGRETETQKDRKYLWPVSDWAGFYRSLGGFIGSRVRIGHYRPSINSPNGSRSTMYQGAFFSRDIM